MVGVVEVGVGEAAEDGDPLPMFIELQWNHYIGFYFNRILRFFQGCFPFPTAEEEMWIQLCYGNSKTLLLNGSQIISHLFLLYANPQQQFLSFICHFRPKSNQKRKLSEMNSIDHLQGECQLIQPNQIEINQQNNEVQQGLSGAQNEDCQIINRKKKGENQFLWGDNLQELNNKMLFKHYKSSLKASTAVRYGKFGVSVLTVDMSVAEVEAMFNNFKFSKRNQFLGKKEGGLLGYDFIIGQHLRINHVPVRIVGHKFKIQRAVPKQSLLVSFVNQLFTGISFSLQLHGVDLQNMHSSVSFNFLQRYCHPDGFLYFTIAHCDL